MVDDGSIVDRVFVSRQRQNRWIFLSLPKKKGTGAAHRNAEADAAVARREHQEAAGDAAEQGPG